MDLPVICSFWHGQLSFLERVCIASFIEKGHRVEIYAYEDVGPLPAGAVLCDAATILPRERMFFYKGTRTPAVFADLFRLHLLRRETGIWSDLDVYCVKPFAGLGDYVVGIETDAGWRTLFRPTINNAVFACPADSRLLACLLSVFEPGAIPPGLPFWRAAEVRVRKALGDPLPVHFMQFGATGPAPLNHYIRSLGLMPAVRPRMAFYPMPYGTARALLEPNSEIESRISGETYGIHMWHSAMTGRHSGALLEPQPGSFFAREVARLGVAI